MKYLQEISHCSLNCSHISSSSNTFLFHLTVLSNHLGGKSISSLEYCPVEEILPKKDPWEQGTPNFVLLSLNIISIFYCCYYYCLDIALFWIPVQDQPWWGNRGRLKGWLRCEVVWDHTYTRPYYPHTTVHNSIERTWRYVS